MADGPLKIDVDVTVLNEALGPDYPYKVDVVDPGDLQLLKKNARYMTDRTFKTLVENVKRDNNLASVPFCVLKKGKYLVLSGNHRVQAAIEAGIERIMILYTDKKLSRSEEVAIQLSHNSLAGQDDMQILKELWDEIGDLGMKEYAGLDDNLVMQLESFEFDTISESALDFEVVQLMFLKGEGEGLIKTLETVEAMFSKERDYVMKRKEYEKFHAMLVRVKETFTIMNNATAMLKVFELATKQLDGYEQGHTTSVVDLFGAIHLPDDLAEMVQGKIDEKIKAKKLTKSARWEIIRDAFERLVI